MKSNKRKALELEAMLTGVEVIYTNKINDANELPTGTRWYCPTAKLYFIKNEVALIDAILMRDVLSLEDIPDKVRFCLGNTYCYMWRSVSSKTFFDLSK